MTNITRLALSHRKLVVLVWILLAMAGVLTLSSTTNRLTHTFANPGNPGYDANLRIQHRLGVDGGEQPTIAVLHLPPGQTMHTAAGQGNWPSFPRISGG
jgi:RND superfamily putative drug exporter